MNGENDGMADGAASRETVCLPGVCPEVLHPGQTGCKLTNIEKSLEAINTLLQGPDDDPERGFVHQALSCFKLVEQNERRRWTRIQRLTLAGVVVPTLGGMLWWGCTNIYTFIKDVDQAVHEMHEMHQTRTSPKTVLPVTGEVYTVRMNPQQETLNQPRYR